MNNTTSGLNQLISVSSMVINGDTVNSVDARGLHTFLGIGRDFPTWMRTKIIDNVFFSYGIDFVLLPKSGEQTGSGGHNRKEYALTQDTAKKVAMAEQTAKGNGARDYFLQCERIAKSSLKTTTHTNFETQMIGVKYAAEILNVSEVSRAQMVHKTFEINGLPTAMLPAYVENVRVTFSATDLLKKNECGMGVRAFNKLMIEYGYLEVKTRASTKHKDKIKKFNSLTDAGLMYGQNNASPSNPNEVQPRYFEDTFMELFGMVSGV